MSIFKYVSCTVKRRLTEGTRTETTLGTITLEIQPISAMAAGTPFGAIPVGDFWLSTRFGQLPKFTIGETNYTLKEGDFIYPSGYDSTPPDPFPAMEVTRVDRIEPDHFEIYANAVM